MAKEVKFSDAARQGMLAGVNIYLRMQLKLRWDLKEGM